MVFQLANSAPALSVTNSAIAPSARMLYLSLAHQCGHCFCFCGDLLNFVRIICQRGHAPYERRLNVRSRIFWICKMSRGRETDRQIAKRLHKMQEGCTRSPHRGHCIPF